MKKKKGQSRAERVRMRFENLSVSELEEVKAYYQERKVVTFEAEEFYDYYQARELRGIPENESTGVDREFKKKQKDEGNV